MWFDRGLLFWPGRRPARAFVLLGFAVLAAASLGTRPHAEPVKKTLKRHGYDFSRPEPGDILPNPTESIGTPPQLRAYGTVKEMSADKGAKANRAKPQAASVDIASPPSETTEARGSNAGSGAAAAASGGPPAAGSGPAPSQSLIAQHVQKTLAGELAAKGLGSRLVYQPSPLAETDPDIRVSEERAWSSTVASLSESWRVWQLAHGTGEAPRRDAAAGAAAVQKAPGTILLEGAPASVTGDLQTPDL